MPSQETAIVTKFLRERPDDSWTLDAALGERRVRRLEGARRWRPRTIIAEVTTRVCAAGGAGFGTGQKWSFLPKDVFPRVPRGERRRGRAGDTCLAWFFFFFFFFCRLLGRIVVLLV